MNGTGKTVCKEVCSNCKCVVVEKPLKQEQKKEDKKKDNCVATIVGVLSLPDNFCAGATEKVEKKEKNGDCNEVYRDLGECLQKCIVQTSKSSNGKNNGTKGKNDNGK